MGRRYKDPVNEERGMILAVHRRVLRMGEICELLGRAPSKIAQELRRGRSDRIPIQHNCEQFDEPKLP